MEPLGEGEFETDPGRFYGTPKEVFGFRWDAGVRTPRRIAERFCAAHEEVLGLVGIRTRAKLREAKVLRSVGALHVILQQHHLGKRVHRAYVSVHIDRRGRVYLAKNRAVPIRLLPRRFARRINALEALELARDILRTDSASSVQMGRHEKLWYPWEDRLLPAIKIRLQIREPKRRECIVYVDASDGAILSDVDTLAHASGRARVFLPNPVVALGRHEQLLDGDGRQLRTVPRRAYRVVTLRDLNGSGRLEGRFVTTEPSAPRVRRADRRFLFLAHEEGFEECMAYYHVDRVLRHLESLGFRGPSRILRRRVRVNVRATNEDESWYSPGTGLLSFGLGDVNDAEDAETIVHELGHAIQDAIVPDFGQSHEARAMGEGFGDYLALGSFADRRPRRYRTCVMTWDGILFEGDPPCVRDLSTGVTYDDYDGRRGEHTNGLIWGETLVEIFRALGRRTADRLIVESHFQLDGFTKMTRGARAILDADRNLTGGRHRAALLRIFRKRRFQRFEAASG